MSKRVDRISLNPTITSPTNNSAFNKVFCKVEKMLREKYGVDAYSASLGVGKSEGKLCIRICGVTKKAVAHIPDEFEVDGIKVIKKIVGRARTY